MTMFILGKTKCDNCGQTIKANEEFGHGGGRFTHSPKCPNPQEQSLKGGEDE